MLFFLQLYSLYIFTLHSEIVKNAFARHSLEEKHTFGHNKILNTVAMALRTLTHEES